MKIIVDADANPTNNIVERLARDFNLELIFVFDSSHLITPDYGKIIMVDQGSDVADFKILSITNKGDIVITQDYELSSLCLSKNAYVLNPLGFEVTCFTIDTLLQHKYINQKARKAKVKTTNPKKRTKQNDIEFEDTLIKIIKRGVNYG